MREPVGESGENGRVSKREQERAKERERRRIAEVSRPGGGTAGARCYYTP